MFKAPGKGGHQRHFAHAMAAMGVNHAPRRGEHRDMGDRAPRQPAEGQHIAGARALWPYRLEMARKSVQQRLAKGKLAPVGGVSGDRLRRAAIEITVKAENESNAVAADAAQRGTVMKWGAAPVAGGVRGDAAPPAAALRPGR